MFEQNNLKIYKEITCIFIFTYVSRYILICLLVMFVFTCEVIVDKRSVFELSQLQAQIVLCYYAVVVRLVSIYIKMYLQ